MRRIFIYLLFICASIPLGAYPTHTHQLTAPIRNLYYLEETKQLLAEVEKEGPITICTASFGFGASNAAWVPGERAIYINFSKPRSQGSLISSIVFELHNALNSKQFDYYDHLAKTRKISREQYIEAVERLEYAHAQSTAHMLYQGVRKGIFPPDAFWCIPNSFEEHYRLQIEAGHSGHIGCMYDDIIRNTSKSI